MSDYNIPTIEEIIKGFNERAQRLRSTATYISPTPELSRQEWNECYVRRLFWQHDRTDKSQSESYYTADARFVEDIESAMKTARADEQRRLGEELAKAVNRIFGEGSEIIYEVASALGYTLEESDR